MNQSFAGFAAQLLRGDGDSENEQFTPLTGLRLISLRLEQPLINNSHAASGAWRGAAAQAGLRFVALEAEGVLVNGEQAEALRLQAFQATLANYRLVYGDAATINAPFLIRLWQLDASEEQPQRLRIGMESAGMVSME